MRGNSHVRFLGGERVVMPLTYPIVLYLVHVTLRMVLRGLFYLIRWLCIAAALAWIVCGLPF